MSLIPPYSTFKYPTCKGSMALGSACGSCEKCQWEIANGVTRIVSASAPTDIRTAPPFDAQFRGVQFFAVSNGQWHYVNHAGTWQGCPPPIS